MRQTHDVIGLKNVGGAPIDAIMFYASVTRQQQQLLLHELPCCSLLQ
jgi:hypothetical protein